MQQISAKYEQPLTFIEAGPVIVKKVDGSFDDYETMKTYTNVEWYKGKRKIKTFVIHTYCPFCGVKY